MNGAVHLVAIPLQNVAERLQFVRQSKVFLDLLAAKEKQQTLSK